MLLIILCLISLVFSTTISCVVIPDEYYPMSPPLVADLLTYMSNTLNSSFSETQNVDFNRIYFSKVDDAVQYVLGTSLDTLITCLPALPEISTACARTPSTCLLLSAGISTNAAPPTLPTLFFAIPTALTSLQATWNHIRLNYASTPNACINYILADNFSGQAFREAVDVIARLNGVVANNIITLPVNLTQSVLDEQIGQKLPCQISFTNHPLNTSQIASTIFSNEPNSLVYTFPFIQISNPDPRILTTDFFPLDADGEYPETSKIIIDKAQQWNLTTGQHLVVAEITSSAILIATQLMIKLNEISTYSELFYSSSLLYNNDLSFGPFVPGNFCVNNENFGKVPGNYAWRSWFITNHLSSGLSSSAKDQATVLTPIYQGVDCINQTTASVVYMMNAAPYVKGSPTIDVTSAFSATIASIERQNLVVTGVFERNNINVAATSGTPLSLSNAVNILNQVLNLTEGRFLALGGLDNFEITESILNEIVIPRNLLIFGSLTDVSTLSNYSNYIVSFRASISDQVFTWLNAVNKTQGQVPVATIGMCGDTLFNESIAYANFFSERYRSLKIPFPSVLEPICGNYTFIREEIERLDIKSVLFSTQDLALSNSIRGVVPSHVTLYYSASSITEKVSRQRSRAMLPNTFALSSHYSISNPGQDHGSIVNEFISIVGEDHATGPAFIGFYTALALSSYVSVLTSFTPTNFKTAVLSLPAISVAGLRFGPFQNCVFGAKQVYVNALDTTLSQFTTIDDLTVSFETCQFQPPAAPEQSTLPSYSIALLAIAGILLAIAIIVSTFFFLWLKKMRKKNKENNQLVQQQEELLKQREVTLDQATEATEAALREQLATSRAKSLLLSTSSHELKTPLNSILGLATLLSVEKNEDCVADVSVACNEMIDLITAIIDASKIESNSLTLFATSFKPHEPIYELVREFAWAKRLVYLPHISTPKTVNIDLVRFIEVLKLIIKNSIQFAKSGPIILITYTANDHFIVGCADQGPGIPQGVAKNIDHLFFVAGEQQNVTGSSGMGFPISIALTQLMGGDFIICSDSTGTSSWAIFPLESSETLEMPTKHLSFVQAEDNWLKRLAIASLAFSEGYFLNFSTKVLYPRQQTDKSIIDSKSLFDFMSKPIVYSTDPLFALPGLPVYKFNQQLDVCSKKILVENSLIKASPGVDQYTYSFFGAACIVYPDLDITKGPEISDKILIVDDEPLNIRILQSQLKKLGLEADSVTSGKAAIEYVKNSTNIPTVIFMDMRMPGMDGIETTKLIKQTAKVKINFICTSAETTFDTSEFVYVLQKPITLSKLEVALDIAK